MSENKNDHRPYNIVFSTSAWDTVSAMAQRYHLSRAETIREALSLMWWATREMDAGSKVLIQRDKAINEVVFSFRERI